MAENQRFPKMTLSQHLEELRYRLLRCVVVVGALIAVSLLIQEPIMKFVTLPLVFAKGYLAPEVAEQFPNLMKLQALAPADVFFTYMKVSIIFGLLVASPFVMYQMWQFVGAGLYQTEKKQILIYGPISFLLFGAGVAVGFTLVLPLALQFLLTFGDMEVVTPQLAIDRYLSFFFMLTLVFGLTFELPLVMLFVQKVGLAEPEDFAKYRTHAIVGMFVVGAFLTPPDVVTQLLMACPLIVLYEVGIILGRLNRRKKAAEAAQETSS